MFFHRDHRIKKQNNGCLKRFPYTQMTTCDFEFSQTFPVVVPTEPASAKIRMDFSHIYI